MTEKGDGAWYVISVAAERAEVHEQTWVFSHPHVKATALIVHGSIRIVTLSASSIFAVSCGIWVSIWLAWMLFCI
jgi:hypothetical protein